MNVWLLNYQFEEKEAYKLFWTRTDALRFFGEELLYYLREALRSIESEPDKQFYSRMEEIFHEEDYESVLLYFEDWAWGCDDFHCTIEPIDVSEIIN